MIKTEAAYQCISPVDVEIPRDVVAMVETFLRHSDETPDRRTEEVCSTPNLCEKAWQHRVSNRKDLGKIISPIFTGPTNRSISTTCNT